MAQAAREDLLEIGPTDFSETSVSNHQSALRNGPGVPQFSLANDRLAGTSGPRRSRSTFACKGFLNPYRTNVENRVSS